MSNYKRKDFRKWYEKYHELEVDKLFIKKKEKNNGNGLELHHIIPFMTVDHNISVQVVDSLLNLIYLDKDLHDKLSESINVSDIRYFGIEFKNYENDENSEINCISFFDIRYAGNSNDKYFKYKNEIKFKNGELVFFKPELSMAIQRYNRIFLEINKHQLEGKWASKKEVCITSLNEFLENIFKFSKKINCNEQLYFRGESSPFVFRTPSLYRHETLTIEGSEDYYRKLLNELGRDDYLENSTLVRLISELQHYGSKTRMLDITSNPLIALYFAVEKDDNTPGYLYIYKSNTENEKFDTGYTNAKKSALNLISQRVIDNYSEEIKKEISESTDELRFIIEKDIEIEVGKSYYPLIKIDEKYKQDIRSQLEILGITEGFVYSDISHYSETLLKKFDANN